MSPDPAVYAKSRAAVISLLALSWTCGCMVGPDYRPPQISGPSRFLAASTQPSSTQPSTPPAQVVDLQHWWESFHDPVLNQLIAEGIGSNLDVQLATARVLEARANLQGNVATLFPTVDGTASYSRNQFSKNGLGSIGGAGSSTSSGAAFGLPGSRTNLYQAGFDAGWEVDLFGGTRRAIEAAEYTLESQIDARRNAMITFLSEVARNYMIARGLQQELAIVNSNVTSQREFLELTRSRFQGGIATDLDVSQQEAQVASTESSIPTIKTQIQQAIHSLGVLLGRNPEDLEAELAPTGPLPGGPPAVPPGLPSDLLRRRPDVQQAERQLASATANIGVATADLFPKLNLTGSFGWESQQLKSWFSPGSQMWSFGPSLSWRIFDAGQIWANIHVQNARQLETLIQYRQSVLQAFTDVEDALVAYQQEQERREALRRSVEGNERSVALAKQLNQAGIVDFLNVLTAEQNLFISQDQLSQSNQAVSTNLVALYKALGGGWETFDPS